MAMQNPFFGGGFKALEYFPVWQSLSQEFFSYPFFYTGDSLPNTERARAAHSVYFQVLGDHGFVGLAIYLTFLFQAFRTAGRVAKKARKHLFTSHIAAMATTTQLCIFAFCLGGAGLSFAYFELVFAICAIIQVLDSRLLPAALAQNGVAAKGSGNVQPQAALS